MSAESHPTSIRRMKCPACGAEMNPHAEKLIAPRTPLEAAEVDWTMGGIVEETHQCPSCGRVESRIAPHARAR